MTSYGQWLKRKLVSWLTLGFGVLMLLSWWQAPEGQPRAKAAALVIALVLLVLNPIFYLMLRKQEKKEGL